MFACVTTLETCVEIERSIDEEDLDRKEPRFSAPHWGQARFTEGVYEGSGVDVLGAVERSGRHDGWKKFEPYFLGNLISSCSRGPSMRTTTCRSTLRPTMA